MPTKLYRFEQGEIIALQELKCMLPLFLLMNGVVLIISGIYALTGGKVGFQFFSGVAFGSVASALNFFLIGRTAGKAVRARRSKGFFQKSYALRYLTIFIVFALLIHFELMSVYTAVVPLLYPSLYYKIIAIFNKTV